VRSYGWRGVGWTDGGAFMPSLNCEALIETIKKDIITEIFSFVSFLSSRKEKIKSKQD